MTIDVVVEEMRDHSRKLDSIAQSGQEAVSAGQEVTTNGDAYGVICSFIGASLLPVQGSGVAVTMAATASVSALAEGVRATATVFESADGVVSDAFKWLKGS